MVALKSGFAGAFAAGTAGSVEGTPVVLPVSATWVVRAIDRIREAVMVSVPGSVLCTLVRLPRLFVGVVLVPHEPYGAAGPCDSWNRDLGTMTGISAAEGSIRNGRGVPG